MQKTLTSTRAARTLGVGVLLASVLIGYGTTASVAEDEAPTPAATPATPTPTTTRPAEGDTADEEPRAREAARPAGPYGSPYPVMIETNFARPYKSISSSRNSDFSLLNDLERLIRGSYKKPSGSLRPKAERRANSVSMSISRMENSHRVGRELVRAAKAGVKVRVIHGKASQSKESRALQRTLNSSSLGSSGFKICQKGKSLACLGSINGAIMHTKLLLVSSTYTRDGDPAKGVIWTGSSNLGGPSGERTWNNGLTIYNDKKLWYGLRQMWKDMEAERNVGNNYLKYIDTHEGRYAMPGSSSGYTKTSPSHGMFYSNLANATIYATPIEASPTNGRDPVIAMLNRVIPDDKCRIRLQQNRFKYRRIAVAQRLVALANAGCKVEGVYFRDDLKVNRVGHCQQWIRVCRPILDVFKTGDRRIEAAWAKPHDKTILVEARMRANSLNPEEVSPDGRYDSDNWPSNGLRLELVQAGSAALTGSNLVVSDEVTTETTDPEAYEEYLEHYKAILKSREMRNYPY